MERLNRFDFDSAGRTWRHVAVLRPIAPNECDAAAARGAFRLRRAMGDAGRGPALMEGMHRDAHTTLAGTASTVDGRRRLGLLAAEVRRLFAPAAVMARAMIAADMGWDGGGGGGVDWCAAVMDEGELEALFGDACGAYVCGAVGASALLGDQNKWYQHTGAGAACRASNQVKLTESAHGCCSAGSMPDTGVSQVSQHLTSVLQFHHSLSMPSPLLATGRQGGQGWYTGAAAWQTGQQQDWDTGRVSGLQERRQQDDCAEAAWQMKQPFGCSLEASDVEAVCPEWQQQGCNAEQAIWLEQKRRQQGFQASTWQTRQNQHQQGFNVAWQAEQKGIYVPADFEARQLGLHWDESAELQQRQNGDCVYL